MGVIYLNGIAYGKGSGGGGGGSTSNYNELTNKPSYTAGDNNGYDSSYRQNYSQSQQPIYMPPQPMYAAPPPQALYPFEQPYYQQQQHYTPGALYGPK